MTLWSFATMEYFNKNIYLSLASRISREVASRAKPQELSNAVWALATAEVIPEFIDVFDVTLLSKEVRPSLSDAEQDPVTYFFILASQELMRRPHEFKSQEIKDVLWSFSKVC